MVTYAQGICWQQNVKDLKLLYLPVLEQVGIGIFPVAFSVGKTFWCQVVWIGSTHSPILITIFNDLKCATGFLKPALKVAT